MTRTRRMRTRRSAAAVIDGGAGIARHAPVAAPRERAASAPGRWLPRRVDPIPGVTAAQRAEAIEAIDRIERDLRQVPEPAGPDACEILPIVAGGRRQAA